MESISNFFTQIFNDISTFQWPKLPLVDREITIFEIVVVLLGLYFAWRANWFAKSSKKDEAARELAAKKVLDVTIFGVSPNHKIVLFAPFESEEIVALPKTRFGFPTPIEIHNPGSTTVENIEVFLKVNSEFYRADALKRTIDEISKKRGVVTATNLIDGEQILTVFWGVGDLSPKMNFEIKDLLFSSLPTEGLIWKTSATTADDVGIDLSGKVSLALEVELVITAKDMEPLKFPVSIGLKKTLAKDPHENAKLYANLRGEGDVSALACITFAQFKEPQFSISSREHFRNSIRTKDESYRDMIEELVPVKYKTEGAARKHLWTLVKNRTLVGETMVGFVSKSVDFSNPWEVIDFLDNQNKAAK